MNNEIEIRYVRNGLASNFGEYIELNENLKKYPQLHKKILKHELGHSKKNFSKHDFMHDLTEAEVSQFDLIKFMCRHPRSLLQVMPIYYTREKGLVLDPNMLIMYFFVFASVFAIGYLGFRYF